MEIRNQDALTLRLRMDEETGFSGELRDLLNKYSKESQSNTPDFILCRYLQDCLCAFENAIGARTRWYFTEEEEPPSP